jgi:hypothetical protein
MVEIYFEIDGKRVSPDQVGDAIERAIIERAVDIVRNELRSTYCDEHEESPTIIFKGLEEGQMEFEVEACCQDLMDAVYAKLE